MERHWEDGDDRKLAELLRILREMKSIVVACSGGADSVFLAAAAHHALGARALIVTAVSASLPRRELADVQRLARAYGWTHRVVGTRELENEAYAVNASDRCYHCKAELFRQLRALADAEGYEWVADGSNTDDLRDYRPGARAQREWQVRCPLQEAPPTSRPPPAWRHDCPTVRASRPRRSKRWKTLKRRCATWGSDRCGSGRTVR